MQGPSAITKQTNHIMKSKTSKSDGEKERNFKTNYHP